MDLAIARALHVLAVVIWAGGLSMATTVALPAVRAGQLGADRLAAFSKFQSRFVWQARTAIAILGLSGLYMVARLDLWGRFTSPQFLWMHAMVGLWALFALVRFVAEPLFLHRLFARWASREPGRAFAALQRGHWVLLILTLMTILAAVAGSQGHPWF